MFAALGAAGRRCLSFYFCLFVWVFFSSTNQLFSVFDKNAFSDAKSPKLLLLGNPGVDDADSDAAASDCARINFSSFGFRAAFDGAALLDDDAASTGAGRAQTTGEAPPDADDAIELLASFLRSISSDRRMSLVDGALESDLLLPPPLPVSRSHLERHLPVRQRT